MDVSEFPHRSLPGAIDDDQIRNATSSITYIMENFDAPDIVHESDAYETLILNVTVIGCLLLAYYVKVYRVYSLPESAGTIMAGMVIGGIAILWTDDLQLFEFVSVSFTYLAAFHPSFTYLTAMNRYCFSPSPLNQCVVSRSVFLRIASPDHL